mmetsp:Transcript_52382/g.131643  ORF Transcript_52382/g.131643 Transcript_52382/m.131643 type:complete len:301 (+) Transcript_52382:3-905(+)
MFERLDLPTLLKIFSHFCPLLQGTSGLCFGECVHTAASLECTSSLFRQAMKAFWPDLARAHRTFIAHGTLQEFAFPQQNNHGEFAWKEYMRLIYSSLIAWKGWYTMFASWKGKADTNTLTFSLCAPSPSSLLARLDTHTTLHPYEYPTLPDVKACRRVLAHEQLGVAIQILTSSDVYGRTARQSHWDYFPSTCVVFCVPPDKESIPWLKKGLDLAKRYATKEHLFCVVLDMNDGVLDVARNMDDAKVVLSFLKGLDSDILIGVANVGDDAPLFFSSLLLARLAAKNPLPPTTIRTGCVAQ